MNESQPTPPLPNVITHHKTKPERYTRHFCISHNEKVDWLAVCETKDFLLLTLIIFL
jgi:hypothetical protein